MRTIPLRIEDAPRVAALHVHGIDKGFISSLGLKFVTALYKAIAGSSSSFGFAIENDDRIVGFVAFTTNLSKLYKSIIAREGWRFALLLAGRLFSLKRIKRVLETLLYPKRTGNTDEPQAELLSIVVAPELSRRGLGRELVRKGLERCRQMGLDKVRVLVGADNEPANRLYRKCGFTFVEQINNHGQACNIYEAEPDKALRENLERVEVLEPALSSALEELEPVTIPMPEPATPVLVGASTMVSLSKRKRSA